MGILSKSAGAVRSKVFFKLFPKVFAVTFAAMLAASAAILQGCEEKGVQLKKTVTGKAGEVVVICDKINWESEAGAALRGVLAVDYPQLPQKEPSFNLINIQKSNFNDLFRSHRNIIYLNINPDIKEPKVTMERDRWAQPQLIIFIEAADGALASALIEKNSELIFNAIDQIEKDRIIRNAKRYEEPKLRAIVSEAFGGSPFFPNGYSLKKQTKNFIWISYETTYTIQGILIYTVPFDGEKFPSLDSLIAEQNEVLKKNVPGMFENSYMTTATAVPPVMKNYRYKGQNFVEVRGLWEVANDYMGGPFVEHVFYSKERGKLLVIEGFVYGPRYKKRNYLRQVEAIIYSFDWAENFQNK